jgi:DUF4097 and DUF4098 domain-containing protein YvlB
VGRIAISTGDEGGVEVEAEKHAATKEDLAQIQLRVEKKANVITIVWESNEPIVNRSLDITIKAPRTSSLQLSTGNGAVTIEGFQRGVEAKTGVGSITIKGVAGNLMLHTGNGAIEAEGATGAVVAETGVGAVTIKGSEGTRTIHTGNGSIRLEGAVGAVSARTNVGGIDIEHTQGDLALQTGNGEIQVNDANGGIVAKTGVGAVNVAGRLAGQCRIATGNGVIVVALPTGSQLTIDAATGNGSIRTDFALPVEGMVSQHSKGRLGDGSGGSLHMKTGVGSIELKKQ